MHNPMKIHLRSLLTHLSLVLCVGLVFTLTACEGDNSNIEGNPPVSKKSYFANAGQIRPVAIGDSVFLEIGYKSEAASEVAFTLNGASANAIKIEGAPGRYWVSTKGSHIGTNGISAVSTFADQTTESIGVNVYVKSDITPEKLTYVVLQEFEHDPSYYTQGLVYEEGWIYEGTGLTNESRLACYNLQTREMKHEIAMDNQIFGEGITIFDGKIYQITYQSGKVFVYDKETFTKVRDFAWYSEGWGLTHNGTELILSDGTATLYFIDPATFTETRKLEIADDYGPVLKINELEYVDGLVYANVWQTDRIIVIDPESGKVVKETSLAGILPDFAATVQQDFVLNGIAYNSSANTFIVTGKKWPKMFEIAFQSIN